MQLTKKMGYKKREKKSKKEKPNHMKTLKKPSSIVIIMVLCIVHPIQAMEQSNNPSKTSWVTYAGATIFNGFSAFKQFLSYTAMPQTQDPFPFTELPEETQTIIIQLLASYCITKSLKDSAYILNALAQTNKRLNNLINGKKFTLKLIKDLAHQFNCSDETAAKILQTKGAKKRLLLQNQLKDICEELIVEQENNNAFARLNTLCKNDIDLEFTYKWDEHAQALTPLMYAAQHGNKFLVNYLLKKNVNINQSNVSGETALTCADISVMPLLLANPNLNINQQDYAGNTALFKEIKNYFVEDEENNPAFLKIKMLLEAGADPMIANNKGYTSVQAAEETGDQKLIELVQDTIGKAYAQEQ